MGGEVQGVHWQLPADVWPRGSSGEDVGFVLIFHHCVIRPRDIGTRPEDGPGDVFQREGRLYNL